MRPIIILVCCLLAMVVSAEENLKHAKTYQSFSSSVDAQLTLVPAEKDDHVYLYFENFESELDDFVGLYKAARETSKADANIRYQLVGTSTAHLRNHHDSTLLAGSWVEYLEVLLPESAPVKIFLMEKADIYKARRVIERYEEQQGLLVSGIAVKKLIKEKQREMQAACGNEVTLTLKDFTEKTTPGLLQGHLSSLAQLCREDRDYRELISGITDILASEHEQADGHSIELRGSQLYIAINAATANTGPASYELLQNIL